MRHRNAAAAAAAVGIKGEEGEVASREQVIKWGQESSEISVQASLGAGVRYVSTHQPRRDSRNAGGLWTRASVGVL